MILRHAASPRPLPPLPLASGPDFVVKNESKMRRRFSRGDPAARIADCQIDGLGGWVVADADQDVPTGRHGLTCVDEQIQQDLLDLVDVGHDLGHRLETFFHADAVLAHLAVQQHQRVVHHQAQVDRFGAWLRLRAMARMPLVMRAARSAAARILDSALSRVWSSVCRMPSLA